MRVRSWIARTACASLIASSMCLGVSVPALAVGDTPEVAAPPSKPLDLRARPKKPSPKAPNQAAKPAAHAKPAVKKPARSASSSKALAVNPDDIPKLVLRDPEASKPTAALKGAAGSAAEPAVKSEAPKAAPARAPEIKVSSNDAAIAKFCSSLSPAASDGRLAWEARRMEEMETRLRETIAELEAKRAETADWLKRREEAMKMADESVVAIYSKMKPDAAAAQFSAMDESGAAAILIKLNPRAASTVLNEIEANRAARIAAEMAGVGIRREIARSMP